MRLTSDSTSVVQGKVPYLVFSLFMRSAVPILVGLLTFSGCAASTPNNDFKLTGPDGIVWAGPGARAFDEYIRRASLDEALGTVRDEYRLARGGTRRAHLGWFALHVLGSYVRARGLQPGLDEEARRYFDEAMRDAGQDEELQSLLTFRLGEYYGMSWRTGLALPYWKLDLEYHKKKNNTFEILRGYERIGETYYSVGELALGDLYQQKSMRLAQEYFSSDLSSPSQPDQWSLYTTMLMTRIDNIATYGGKPEEILRLWKVLEPINKKFTNPKFRAYLATANRLALLGAHEEARALFEQAKEVWQEESGRYKGTSIAAETARTDFLCAGSVNALWAEQFGEATKEIEQCLVAKWPSNYRLAGMAFEGAGDLVRARWAYETSIGGFESARGSYSVGERATFFGNSVYRSAYWGLIRVLARIAVQSRTEQDVLAAVQATERIRARQLGELLDAQAEATISIENLRSLTQGLAPDSLILDYILTDQAIVLLALAKDRQGAWLIPYQKREFDGKLRKIAQALADPSSDQQAIARDLSTISQTLVSPAADLLKGKKQLLVLPDGSLNLIPFDLLTARPDAYRPLVQNVVLRVVPSLRLLQAQTASQGQPNKTAGLAALGDPVYTKSPQVAGLTEAELRAVTRGSNYLSYFSPLPETRTEVQAIAKQFKDEPVKMLLGPLATETSVKGLELEKFRYLHFATHGITGGEVPGIGEPALVLGEEPGSDGFLKASEAEALKLNADLTVLSACKTGSGEMVEGEGVLGMSRAFLVAGSKAVVVSLWSVESKATEDLMVAFYRHVRSGMDAAEALRQAKLEIMGSVGGTEGAGRGVQVQPGAAAQGRQHPFYWAPFILVGR